MTAPIIFQRKTASFVAVLLYNDYNTTARHNASYRCSVKVVLMVQDTAPLARHSAPKKYPDQTQQPKHLLSLKKLSFDKKW
jgi:hypothetical protein